MNRIRINHAPDASKYNWLAIALLLVGLSVFVSTFVYMRQMAATSESLKSQVETQAAPTATRKSSNRTPDTNKIAELAAVNTAIGDIVLPWSELFRALERAHQENVKLLGIEPNAQERRLRITAVSFSVENMLAYIKHLNEQDMLRLVNLTSTESVEVNGQTATQFELNINW